MQRSRANISGLIGAFWGVGGVLLLVAVAIVKLSQPAAEALSFPLRWFHWVALLPIVGFFLYGKGYHGFSRALAPHIARRAAALRAEPTTLRVLLAPLYCLGYFHNERRKQLAVVGMTLAMAGFIFLLPHLGQPWRGLLDVGIVAALVWGFGSILLLSLPVMVAVRRGPTERQKVARPPL